MLNVNNSGQICVYLIIVLISGIRVNPTLRIDLEVTAAQRKCNSKENVDYLPAPAIWFIGWKQLVYVFIISKLRFACALLKLDLKILLHISDIYVYPRTTHFVSTSSAFSRLTSLLTDNTEVQRFRKINSIFNMFIE